MDQCDGSPDAPSGGMTAVHGERITDQKQLGRLRQSHRLTFERYLDITTRICGRLGTLTPESMSDLDRANLQAGKRKEAAAREAYLKARCALMRYLEGPGMESASSLGD